MIRSGCHRAQTQEEKDAVYRFRYEIYVSEMGRYGAADVYAATDGRIRSLSEGTLRKSIKSDPEIAATLLLNISKILCKRLLNA